jgi:protein gp37
MRELFHKGAPDEYVEAVGHVMERANWHTYHVLTKRSSRLRDMLEEGLEFGAGLRNIWWGECAEVPYLFKRFFRSRARRSRNNW